MMATVKIPFVDERRDRHGRTLYYYFRRNGRLWRLPSDPFSEEFAAEYTRLKALTDRQAASMADTPLDKRHFGVGTFGKLINDYLNCGEYKQLKPRTKAEYKRVLEALQRLYGHLIVVGMKRRHIRKMRDAKADTPGAANTILRMLKLVLIFAVNEDWIEANPATKLKLQKVGIGRAW